MAKMCSGTTASSGSKRRPGERDGDHLVGERQHRGIALLGDRDHAGTAGADLLDVRDDLGVQRERVARARHDHEHELAGLDQRDRAVLELAGGEALGVDVGELLELERALERDRVSDVAAEEEHRLGVGHPVRELADLLLRDRAAPRRSSRARPAARRRSRESRRR